MMTILCPNCKSTRVLPIFYTDLEGMSPWITELNVRRLIWVEIEETPARGPWLFCWSCGHKWSEDSSVLRQVVHNTPPLGEEEFDRLFTLDMASSLLPRPGSGELSSTHIYDGKRLLSVEGELFTTIDDEDVAKAFFNALKECVNSVEVRQWVCDFYLVRGYEFHFSYEREANGNEQIRIAMVPPSQKSQIDPKIPKF